MDRSRIVSELDNCILGTDFEIPNKKKYQGKVRDCYFDDRERIIIASDRISAFDHVFNQGIPFKGQILNQLAIWSLRQTEDIIPNHIIKEIDPNVILAKECTPIRLEVVIRGYLAGYAWRAYREGKRMLCGVSMPDNMRQNQAFPSPIFTPSTKAEEGHDLDISKAEVIDQGILTATEYEHIEEIALALFERGSQIAREHGLILVDTKYEFGYYEGKLMLMDEIHTPDSSRYFYLDGYQERLDQDIPQKQLSKEFVREWLIDHNFQGLEGQIKPDLPDDFRVEISERYTELFEHLTGTTFIPAPEGDALGRISNALADFS